MIFQGGGSGPLSPLWIRTWCPNYYPYGNLYRVIFRGGGGLSSFRAAPDQCEYIDSYKIAFNVVLMNRVNQLSGTDVSKMHSDEAIL